VLNQTIFPRRIISLGHDFAVAMFHGIAKSKKNHFSKRGKVSQRISRTWL
jgi:hypothetical protein